MSNKPAGHILADDEMMELAESQHRSRLYSKDADGSEKIQAIVETLSDELKQMPKKISLRDTETVVNTAQRYVNACGSTGTIPTKIGLCRAMGCSRNAVDNFMGNNPEHPTTEALRIIFDAFSEALNAAALSGSVQPIVSIFISKAVYGWRDTAQIEVVQNSTMLGPELSAEDIEKRIISDYEPIQIDDE